MTNSQAPQPVDGDVRELRKWLNEQPNRPVDRDALARLLHAFENAQPVGEIVTDCDGETVLGDEVSWRVGMPPAGTKLYAAPCAAVGEAPDHLELFKEASEWAETAKRKITPDMVELLGWLTGAANAWAEKVEDRAKAAIPAPEGAQLPPLPEPEGIGYYREVTSAAGTKHVYRQAPSFTADQMHAYARAALAAPRVTEGAQALTETQIERAWRLGFRHACDAERLNSDEEWGYKRANVIEEVEALAAPAPQDSLDSAQSSKGVAMQAPQAPAWQPIETAPQDGRTVLLGYFNACNKWRTLRGEWMSQEFIDENWEEPDNGEPGWYETSVENDDVPNCWRTRPTHWMPLPAAPQTKEPKA